MLSFDLPSCQVWSRGLAQSHSISVESIFSDKIHEVLQVWKHSNDLLAFTVRLQIID